jgi:hypothetical protein
MLLANNSLSIGKQLTDFQVFWVYSTQNSLIAILKKYSLWWHTLYVDIIRESDGAIVNN